jgi:hypothetical protein
LYTLKNILNFNPDSSVPFHLVLMISHWSVFGILRHPQVFCSGAVTKQTDENEISRFSSDEYFRSTFKDYSVYLHNPQRKSMKSVNKAKKRTNKEKRTTAWSAAAFMACVSWLVLHAGLVNHH